MHSGKILPGFKSILANAIPARASDRDQKSNQEQQDDRPKRQPTQEEVLEALEFLSQHESFQKNGLRAEATTLDGKQVISVKDAAGKVLRTIHGEEILRILADSKFLAGRSHLGSILDRRI